MANITKRGDSFRLTVSLGYDVNGKRIRKYTTFTPPTNTSDKKAQKLAEQAYYEFEQKCKGNVSLNENMRFSELAEWYFEHFAPSELKEVTSYNYQATIKNHVLKPLGNVKIKDITTVKLTAIFKTLSKPATERKALSPATVKKTHTVLSSVFHCAVRQGFLKENPCKNAILPKQDNKKRRFLSTSEAKKLLATIEDYSTYNTVFKTLMYTGMRSGECLGLQWEDIDFTNSIIHIRHTLSYSNKHYYLSEPKTKNSIRDIKAPASVMKLLTLHFYKQQGAKANMFNNWQRPTMVFTNELGNYIDRSFLNKQFKKHLASHDILHITLHDLRHFYATALINNGLPIKVVSELLGHCDIGVTADTYAHVLLESKAKASQAVELALK